MVPSEGSRVLKTETETPIVLVCGVAMKFVLSLVDSLDPCRHMLYTFLDVLSYHSNAVSKVATASHPRRSIEREIDQLGHFKRL